MKAMIFAAGLGTRLFPYTASKPKALVEVAGVTLLERAIRKIEAAGFNEIVINIHHYGDQIIEFLREKKNFGLTIHVSDEREQLLDTGGGILNARQYLAGDEPFLVYNVDVIGDVDLQSLVSFHQQNNALATLSVRKRETSRYFMFNNTMQLCGWLNTKTGEERVTRNANEKHNYAFSGIHLINPELFNLITEQGKFSIVDLYLRLSANSSIIGCIDSSSVWMDLGKPDQLLLAEQMYNEGLLK